MVISLLVVDNAMSLFIMGMFYVAFMVFLFLYAG